MYHCTTTVQMPVVAHGTKRNSLWMYNAVISSTGKNIGIPAPAIGFLVEVDTIAATFLQHRNTWYIIKRVSTSNGYGYSFNSLTFSEHRWHFEQYI